MEQQKACVNCHRYILMIVFVVAKLEPGRVWLLKHDDSKFEQRTGDHGFDGA